MYGVIGEGQIGVEAMNASRTNPETTVSQTGKISAFSLDVQNATSMILHVYF